MNVTVNKTVSYVVQNVKIINIILTKDTSSNLVVGVPFSWLDSTNTVIRSDNKRYTATQLTAAFLALGQDFAPVATALTSLIPTLGTSGNCNLILTDSVMTAIQGYSGIVDGQPKWISTQLNNTQLVSAIAPITTDQLTSMITMFATSVTA